MDIPLDVQAKIDALVAEYNKIPKVIIWMGHRQASREIDSHSASLVLDKIAVIKAPYEPKGVKWTPESKESKKRRVDRVVQHAMKQSSEASAELARWLADEN